AINYQNLSKKSLQTSLDTLVQIICIVRQWDRCLGEALPLEKLSHWLEPVYPNGRKEQPAGEEHKEILVREDLWTWNNLNCG
ncbi:MAG: hypothetical protein OSJ58_12005, partial [Dysosmobacter sp.]|nr:hypothetical protein [Dysosmobacter sp.]